MWDCFLVCPPQSPHRGTHMHTRASTHTYTFQLIRRGLETHHCLAPGECQQHWVLCCHRGRIVCPGAFCPPAQETRRLPLFTRKFCVRKCDASTAAWSVECTACQHGSGAGNERTPPGEADTRLRAALDVLSGIHGRACFAKRRTVEEHGLQPAYQNLTFQNSLRVF